MQTQSICLQLSKGVAKIIRPAIKAIPMEVSYRLTGSCDFGAVIFHPTYKGLAAKKHPIANT